MKENDIKEILKDFDEQLETQANKRIKNSPMLGNLFEQVISEIYDSQKCKRAIEKKQEIANTMKLTDEQEEILEEYNEQESLISDEMVKRAFIFGYACCNELFFESKGVLKNDNHKIEKH